MICFTTRRRELCKASSRLSLEYKIPSLLFLLSSKFLALLSPWSFKLKVTCIYYQLVFIYS